MDHNNSIVSDNWQHFLEVRVCPHCGHNEWWAAIQDLSTERQRWIYHCGDADCNRLWGPPQSQRWITVGTQHRWGITP